MFGASLFARLDVFAKEFDDVFGRRSGKEYLGYALRLQLCDILLGNYSTKKDKTVVHSLIVQKSYDARTERVVRAAEYRNSDSINVLLQCCRSDHFGSLAQSGVDNLHAGVA